MAIGVFSPSFRKPIKNIVKVSIIIPVYQVSAYIERCIKSVMGQTYNDIECIIVNDRTEDDCISICERLIAIYNGPIAFYILHHGQNRGLSAARNTGTKAANGEYIYYLDGDDEISSDCIEKMVAPILKDESIEMVMGGVARDNGVKIFYKKMRNKDYPSNISVRDYFFSKNGFYVGAWNKLIKKDFLVKNQLFFTERLLWEDQLWTFLVVKYLSHLYRISDITYFYYMRPNSITTGTVKEDMALHWAKVYEIIAENLTPNESGREVKHYVKGFCVRYVEYSWCHEFDTTAEKFMQVLFGYHFLTEFILLKSTVILSRSSIGSRILSIVVKRIEQFIGR